MPNVSVFVSRSSMPDEEGRRQFVTRCTELCTQNLRAALVNVHIIFVPVEPGLGHDAYVEIKYRDESHRTSAVMKEFLLELDVVAKETIGCKTRLRCFGYSAPLIYALN